MAFTKPTAAQINFDVTNISDPLICLNYGQSGTPDDDVGIIIERGSSTNVALIWDESADTFALINTAETGSTAGDVTISSYADLKIGTLTATTLSGNATTATALATGRTIAMTGDVTWTSASFDGSGNVTATASIGSGVIVVADMAANSVDSAQYVDGSIDTAHIADDQITLAKMAGLARGKIIYGNSSGNPTALAVGGDGTALISDGTDVSWGTAGAITSYTNSTNNRVVTSVDSSTVNSEANLTFDGSVLAVTGNVTASGTIEPAGDTSSGDNAAIGYTSAEGLILTGQGSTSDITLKNDADATVISIPTGTTNVTIAGDLTISGDDLTMGTNTSGAALIADGTNFNPVVISGDISINTSGVAAIGSGVIVVADMAANSVDSAQYVDGSIDTDHLAADVITGAKIADDVINSEHYAAASIDNEHLADNAVDSAELAAGSVDLAHMSANSVDSTQYVDGSIDTAHIADDAVTTAKLANSINTNIATGVTAGTVASAALPKAGGAMTGAITTNSTFDGVDIATRDAILTSTTTTAGAALPKAGGTITGNIVMSGSETVDGRDLSTDGTKLDAIESSATADQTNAEIVAAVEAGTDSNTFTNADHSKLNAIEASATADQSASEIKTLLENGINSVHYVDGSIDLVHMSANSIDSAQYVDGSIDTAHFAAGAVDAAAMGANSVNSSELVDGSVDLSHMSANSIDSAQYVDGSIDTAHIADDQITLAKMAGLARGKIIYGDASGNPTALAVGGDGTALKSDGTDISWGTPEVTLTGSQTLTNKTLTSPSIGTGASLTARAPLYFYDSDSSNYVAFRAGSTVASNVTWTLPTADGTADQLMKTDGAGNLSWGSASGAVTGFTNSTITTCPGASGNYDLAEGSNQDGDETPFDTGASDAFGVSLGTVYDSMEPIGSTTTIDYGDGESYVGA